MGENDNIILEHLRAIRGDIGEIKRDIRDIKSRLTSVEIQLAGLRRDCVDCNVRLDEFDERLKRVERRLELAE